MFKNLIKNNITFSSIFIFILLIIIIISIKPVLLYKKDGSFRQFGLGYKNKTITPIWLVCILLSIISYFIVILYCNIDKIEY